MTARAYFDRMMPRLADMGEMQLAAIQQAFDRDRATRLQFSEIAELRNRYESLTARDTRRRLAQEFDALSRILGLD